MIACTYGGVDNDAYRSLIFISHDAGRTGAPIILLSLMRWLRRNTRWEFRTIVKAPGPLLREFEELGPTLLISQEGPLFESRIFRLIDRWISWKARLQVRMIRRFLAGRRFDLVYSNTIINGDILEALAFLHLPVITHVHEMEYWIRRAGKRNLGQVKQRTTAYIAVADAVKDNLVKNHEISPDRVQVVHEFLDVMPSPASSREKSAVRLSIGIPEEGFVVGASGAEFWRKGRDLVTHLLLSLRRQDLSSAVHVVWVGRAGTIEEQTALQFDLERTGMTGLYHETGEVADPHRFFAAFDVFCLLSRDDPFPLVCLEAASMELPILCFDKAGGMPEFVRDDIGYVVPYLDVEAMASRIASLLRNPAVRKDYGAKARKRVAEQHTLDVGARAIVGGMNNVLRNHLIGPRG